VHPRTGKPGWWPRLVGPGKPIDPARHFIICSNVLGGCSGSSGPASLDPVTAERFTARLLSACERIGDAPLAGRPRDDLFPGLRTMAFEKRAVIAYLVEADTVVITNVFYGGRDFGSLMRDGGA
jgi:plasmid stabilization system protein ParE